jgi:hypothetical protein
MEGTRIKKLYQLSFKAVPNVKFPSTTNIAMTARISTSENMPLVNDLVLISTSHSTNPIIWHHQMWHIPYSTMQLGLSCWASGGHLAGGRPCPLRLI